MSATVDNSVPMPVHGHDQDLRKSSKRNLWIAFWLIASFMGVEVVAGLAANSLALLADAGHMVTDAVAILFALFAIWIGSRPATAKMTFGFQRIEIIAASLNAASLWLIAGWIFYDASRRFGDVPEVEGGLTLTVGVIGLLVNLVALWVLNRSRHESLNVKGAFLHVFGDALGSIGVLVAGALILLFKWYIADPIVAVVIGVIILFSSTRLALDTVRILMEAAPKGLDLDALCREFEGVVGVRSVHDIHVWTVTSGYEVMTAHVEMESPTSDGAKILEAVRRSARDRFNIEHVTIQIDSPGDYCAERHHTVH